MGAEYEVNRGMAESRVSLKQRLLPSVPAEVMSMYRDVLVSLGLQRSSSPPSFLLDSLLLLLI